MAERTELPANMKDYKSGIYTVKDRKGNKKTGSVYSFRPENLINATQRRGQEMTDYYKKQQDVATHVTNGLQYDIIQDGENYSGSLQDVSVDDLKMRDGRVKYYQMLQNALRNNNKEEVNRLATIGNQYLKMAYGNKPNLTADNIPANDVNRNNPEAFNNAYNDLMCAAYNDSVRGGNTRLLFTKDGNITLQKRTMDAPSAVIDVYNSFTQKPQLTAEEKYQLEIRDLKNDMKEHPLPYILGFEDINYKKVNDYDQSIADRALEKKNHQTIADVNAKEQMQNDSAFNTFKNNGQYNMPDDPDKLAAQEVDAFNVVMRLSNNYDRLRSDTGTQNMDDAEADKLIVQKYPSTKQAIDQFNFASNKYYSDSEAYSKYAESKGTNFNTYYMYKFNELMANSSQTPQSDKQIYAKEAAKLKAKCNQLGIIDDNGKFKANPETTPNKGASKLMDTPVIGGGKQ